MDLVAGRGKGSWTKQNSNRCLPETDRKAHRKADRKASHNTHERELFLTSSTYSIHIKLKL